MTTELSQVILLVWTALGLGCGTPASTVLMSSVAGAPPAVQDGCRLVTHRCTRCHSLDRVIEARVADPTMWWTYVRWMRLNPGSNIRPAEERPLVDCLVYRDFGAEGLAQLPAEVRP